MLFFPLTGFSIKFCLVIGVLVSQSLHLQTSSAAIWTARLVSMHPREERLTSVIVFKAVSAPMLKSEPGTLLDTVAGTITMGIQNSS